MAEILTIDEINKRFPDEWVLIGDAETDESLEVMRGKVLCYSNDRDEVDQAAIDLAAPKRIAVCIQAHFSKMTWNTSCDGALQSGTSVDRRQRDSRPRSADRFPPR